MKTKFQITVAIFALFLVITSCKGKEKEGETNNSNTNNEKVIKKEIVDDPFFYVTLKAKFSKWDKLHMYYLSEQSDKYSGERKTEKEVIPNGDFQEIKFELKEQVYPYNIRLDFGINKEQTQVLIEECVLHYGNETFKIKGKDLNKYFHFNKGIEVNPDSLTFTLQTFKRGKDDIYDPFIRGNQELNNVLETKL
tara:strand:- start:4040 stop:4621 length:582 start_codon:yes stop_codon:yes gene_type:complete